METYKLIIAGGREFNDFDLVIEHASKMLRGYKAKDVTIISGTAKGADRLGERFAMRYGCNIMRMPADWGTYGKSAGYRRNADMADVADACLVFWNGESKGSRHMIDLAKKKGLRLEVVLYNG